MKIVRLQAENVKRLTAVEITPDGNMITIGGPNGAGKSSVLDSIAYAMGGEKLVPTEPIRAGESDAKIVLDLGDLVVTRKFKREKVTVPAVDPASDRGDGLNDDFWGDTTSTLTVTNKDGARYPSPQAILDKLLGKLTFDPLAFAREKPSAQNEILRRLTNLDFTLLDADRAAAAARRAMHKQTLKVAEVKAASLPSHAGVPTTEISVAAIVEELGAAERLRTDANKASHTVSDAEKELERRQRLVELGLEMVVKAATTLKAAEEAFEQANQELAQRYTQITTQQEVLAQAVTDHAAKQALIPALEGIQAKLSEGEAVNAKVRANVARKAADAEVDRFTALVAEEDTKIKTVDAQKEMTLQSAQFPVVGLGLTDDGVTFGGIPFEQASTSEQIRVSVAIGMALNPTLRVLLIRNGNALDSHSLKLLAEQALAADTQVWVEFVAESKDGMAVMLEDGHVV